MNKQQYDVNGALSVATVVGWAGVMIIDVFSIALATYIPNAHLGETFKQSLHSAVHILPVYFVFGLPVAFVMCFAIGHYFWDDFTDNGRMNLSNAITMGGSIGSIFGIISVFITASMVPWWVSLLDLISTIAVGALAGWLAYLIALKPPETS